MKNILSENNIFIFCDITLLCMKHWISNKNINILVDDVLKDI